MKKIQKDKLKLKIVKRAKHSFAILAITALLNGQVQVLAGTTPQDSINNETIFYS